MGKTSKLAKLQNMPSLSHNAGGHTQAGLRVLLLLANTLTHRAISPILHKQIFKTKQTRHNTLHNLQSVTQHPEELCYKGNIASSIFRGWDRKKLSIVHIEQGALFPATSALRPSFPRRKAHFVNLLHCCVKRGWQGHSKLIAPWPTPSSSYLKNVLARGKQKG